MPTLDPQQISSRRRADPFRGYGENMTPVVRQPEEEQGNPTPAQGVVAAARQACARKKRT